MEGLCQRWYEYGTKFPDTYYENGILVDGSQSQPTVGISDSERGM